MSSYDQDTAMSTLSAALSHPENATLANIHPDLVADSHVNGDTVYVSPTIKSVHGDAMDVEAGPSIGADAQAAVQDLSLDVPPIPDPSSSTNVTPPTDWPPVLAYTPGVAPSLGSNGSSPPSAQKHKQDEDPQAQQEQAQPAKKKARSRKSSAKSKAATIIEEGQLAEYEDPSGDFRTGAIFVHALPNTAQACMRCHMVKRKCDNVRPRCTGCAKVDEPCAYEMSPATTTFVSNLKDETFLLRQELDTTKAELLATKVELERFRAVTGAETAAGVDVIFDAVTGTTRVKSSSPPLRPPTPAITVSDADAGVNEITEVIVSEVVANGSPPAETTTTPNGSPPVAHAFNGSSPAAAVAPETTANGSSPAAAVVIEAANTSADVEMLVEVGPSSAKSSPPKKASPPPAVTATAGRSASVASGQHEDDDEEVEYTSFAQQILAANVLPPAVSVARHETVRARTFPPPTRADLFTAANAWFETYHLSQPFLDRAEIMAEVENVWLRHSRVVNGIAEWWGAGKVDENATDALCLMVLAAGAMVAEGTKRMIMGIGSGLRLLALEAMPELHPTTNDLMSVQTLLALINTLLVDPMPERPVEDILGLCVVTARGLGLFRPVELPPPPKPEPEPIFVPVPGAVTSAETIPQTVTVTDPETIAETVPTTAQTTVTETVPEANAEANAEAKAETSAETNTASNVEPVSATAAGPLAPAPSLAPVKETPKPLDAAAINKRYQVAWSVYSQERLLVTGLDFDFQITDADMMAPMPEPQNDFSCAVFRHRRIMGRIVDLQRRAGAAVADPVPIEPATVTRLEGELDAWLAEWPHDTDGQYYARLLYLKAMGQLLFPGCIDETAPLSQLERLYELNSEALQIYIDKVEANTPSLVMSMQRFRVCTTLLWSMLLRLQRVESLKHDAQFRADVLERIESSQALLNRSRNPDEFSTSTAVQVTQAEYASMFDRLAAVLLTRYSPSNLQQSPVQHLHQQQQEQADQDQQTWVSPTPPTPQQSAHQYVPLEANTPRLQPLTPSYDLAADEQQLLHQVNDMLAATTSPRTTMSLGSRPFNLTVPSSADHQRLHDLHNHTSAPTPTPMHDQPEAFGAPTPGLYSAPTPSPLSAPTPPATIPYEHFGTAQ